MTSDRRGATYRDVLGDPEFRAVFAAQLLSVMGDQVSRLAVSVLVFTESRSPLLAASAYAVTYLPWLVGGPLLASLADRLPRRTLMVRCDLARAGLVGLLAVPRLPVPVLLAVLFAAALLSPPFEAAQSALLPDLLPGDRYVVGQSLLMVMFEVEQVLGLAVGGALVGLLSTRGALLADAATFALSALLLLAGVRHRPAPAPGRSGWREHAVTGLRHVAGHPLLRSLLLLAWSGAAFGVVSEGLAVSYADRHGGGPVAVGLLTAATPLGVALGALLLGRYADPDARRRLMLPVAAAGFLPLLLTAASPSMAVTGVLWLLAGAGAAFQLPANATFAATVDPALRGRAFGIAHTGMQASQGLALLLAGLAAEVLAPSVVVTGSAAVGLVCVGLLALRWPGGQEGPHPVRRDRPDLLRPPGRTRDPAGPPPGAAVTNGAARGAAEPAGRRPGPPGRRRCPASGRSAGR